jgi:hypothetical protein
LWLSRSLTGAALPVLVFKVRLMKGALTGYPIILPISRNNAKPPDRRLALRAVPPGAGSRLADVWGGHHVNFLMGDDPTEVFGGRFPDRRLGRVIDI